MTGFRDSISVFRTMVILYWDAYKLQYVCVVIERTETCTACRLHIYSSLSCFSIHRQYCEQPYYSSKICQIMCHTVNSIFMIEFPWFSLRFLHRWNHRALGLCLFSRLWLKYCCCHQVSVSVSAWQVERVWDETITHDDVLQWCLILELCSMWVWTVVVYVVLVRAHRTMRVQD